MTNEELAVLMGVIFAIAVFFVKAKLVAIDKHMEDKSMHQTIDERKALSDLLAQKMESHEKFDVYRFGQIDETCTRIEAKVNGQDEKLDKILAVVNKWTQPRLPR